MWTHYCRGMVEHVLDLLSARRCAGCDEPSAPALCAQCYSGLIPATPVHFGGIPVFSVSGYAPPLSLAIKRMKYNRRPDIAARLAETLIGVPGLPSALRASCLVPVPLHPSRLQERGFNQSALLARELSRRVQVRVNHRLLRRVRTGPPQARCSGAARRANILGAFSVQPARPPARVALVDDVVTTGSTARECIETLRAAGHQVTAIVAVCCAPEPD